MGKKGMALIDARDSAGSSLGAATIGLKLDCA
jgi:hypothetical protein